jgi:DNA-binding GntR family transcriptional regulator
MLLDPRTNRTSNSHTLADMVFERLADEIVRGALRPGHWVSEHELAARMNVSRAPVREALRDLAREGIVEIRRRRGTIIPDLSADDVNDLYQARAVYEAEMVARAIPSMSEDHVDQLAGRAADLRRMAGTRTTFYDGSLLFWQHVLDACPNRTMREVTAMFWRRSIRWRGLLVGNPRALDNHLAFVDRLVELAGARDAEGARTAVAEFYDRVRQILLEDAFITVGDNEPIARAVIPGSAP